LKKWKAEPTCPNSYAADLPSKKPNIYLYSDRDLTARVRLAPERAITVSEPAYQPGEGWRAQVRDGSLNGAGDFLFYEALVPDSDWQKDEGYVIRAAFREQDMASMLAQYGFNGKETFEFIDYWASHLIENVDYVFYPQETGAVNQVMPLSVSPEPDHVSRIWFYAEPLVSAPDPVTSPEEIVRDGWILCRGMGCDDTMKTWPLPQKASADRVLLLIRHKGYPAFPQPILPRMHMMIVISHPCAPQIPSFPIPAA
jgi:hypothetical protein